MEIEIATIGGYEEVGRQMTAVRAGDDVVIFDMGSTCRRSSFTTTSRPSRCTAWT